jgi:protein-tyrosine sulfotransferase
VIKPVNLEALSKWVGQIPEDVVEEMAELAPMLAHFGYDPNANPPNYGQPDGEVVKNTDEIHKNEAKWQEKEELVKKISKKERKPEW